MLHNLFILLEVILLFNIIILVHELGHFLAARWRGLYVDRFGIWFGKPIWQKKIGDVTYSLGSIPAGGFVSIPQMAPMESIEGKIENEKLKDLPQAEAIDKIIIAAAGPVFSLLLAFAFACIVFFIGRPTSESETTTTIGYVIPASPADKAGLKPGDKILKIDGHTVERFHGTGNSVTWRIVSSEHDHITLDIRRGEELLSFQVTPERHQTQAWERKGLRYIGISPAISLVIFKTMPDTLASRLGLQAEDHLIGINHSTPPTTLLTLLQTFEALKNENRPFHLTFRRGKEIFDHLIPIEALDPQSPVPLGILWSANGKITLDHTPPVEQVRLSIESMINTLGALFSPKSDIKAQHMSGPVGILNLYHRLFKSEDGWRLAIWFSVILNVNLAILNLLPLPVLDGGHILMALIEKIIRRKIPYPLLEKLTTLCAIILIGFMLYITFYDIQDLPFIGKKKPSPTTPNTPAHSIEQTQDPQAPAGIIDSTLEFAPE